MTSVAALEDVGHTIADRYRVEEVLGRGGMGAVYRVSDTRSGRALALKRGFARDPRRAQRRHALLEREYHTLAQIAHPRIIEVFDYGVDDGGPFYTMELLDGADLNAKGPQPWRAACVLLRDVASSLAILHARGLIHRDISARNVRRTADGHAKLIDFGAMTSIGVAKDVVGTPPFVPPEALQMQALDARVDLFSLGALGYYLLTGRHAFPARRLAELRDIWRSTPVPPLRIAQETPAALSVLIMQLLALDRGARPESAAEVMKRLTVIAGLSEEEHAAVSRAYLTAPALVGREQALLLARKRMLALARGDGAAVLIEGASGSGRSRTLDACVLEAKLAGATVVRADGDDNGAGEWGVARVLGAQLLELMPKPALDAARFSRDVLCHVLDGLRSEASTTPSTPLPERGLIIRELRDFVLSLCRQQRLVIAIDDVDRIDEPSRALLAALAHKTERNPLLLIGSVDNADRSQPSASLGFLRAVSLRIDLLPLTPDQTQRLLHSIFGDVSHLQLLANHVHELAQGSPRATMELAQHLVSRGFARYEAGSWSLPQKLDELDLPRTLADSLAARLDELSPDALALAELLCVAEGDALSVGNYPALSGLPDKKRVFAALDELVAARVSVADAERHRFSQRGFLSVLRARMPDERRVSLHASIADLLADAGGDILARARHMMGAGRERDAVELLASIELLQQRPPLWLLERAVEAAVKLALPARTANSLRVALVAQASLMLATASFRRAAMPLLARLEADSGLNRYRELSHLPGPERLIQALAHAQLKFSEALENERCYSALDAIRELARLSSAFCSMAFSVLDLELLELLPSLEPFIPLSPGLEVSARLVETVKAWLAGRSDQGARGYEQVLERIERPDRAALDDSQRDRMRLGIIYGLGLYDAARGITRAEERALQLEGDREMRLHASRVRMLLQLGIGNLDEARKHQRRTELLLLQDHAPERYLGATAPYELLIYSAADDVHGLESARRTLEPLAAQHPGWKPIWCFAQARKLQLEGRLEPALDCVRSALASCQPGRHAHFVYLAALHIDLHSDLGRDAEALRLAESYSEAVQREQLTPVDQALAFAVARAFVRRGERERGLAIVERTLDEAEQAGRSGLALGVIYEARARIAIMSDDRPAFEHYAERCAREFAKGRNAVLSLKFAALMNDARHKQSLLGPIAEPPEARALLTLDAEAESEYGTVHSRIAECVDHGDRARCALTMLLQSFESFAGYLYGANGDRIELLASLPDTTPNEEFERWLHGRYRAELEASQATASVEEGDGDGAYALRHSDPDGRNFEALLLVSERGSHARAAGVLALQVQTGPRTPSSRNLLGDIADLLLAHGDVSGVAL